MKPVRVTLTACVLAVVLFVVFFVPLPVARIRQVGVVQIQPAFSEKVPVAVPGRLERIAVKEGQFVPRGTVLAEFSNLKMEEDLFRAQSVQESNEKTVRVLTPLLSNTTDDQQRAELTQRINNAQIERDFAAKRIETLEKSLKKLVLYAPRDGVVIGVPKQDDVFKTWTEEELKMPFCTIGDPEKLRVLVPIGPSEHDLLRNDMRVKNGQGEALDVTIRVPGLDNHYWRGKVSHVPEAAEKTVPLPLSSKGGGPLAVKPTSKPNALEPQTQVYLVGVDFEEHNNVISAGTLSQVKIHLEYRTCAWWIWRTISQTFDLNLM